MRNSEDFLSSDLRDKLTHEQLRILDGMHFGSRIVLREKVMEAALRMYEGNRGRNLPKFLSKEWLMSLPKKLIEHWIISGTTILLVAMIAGGSLQKDSNLSSMTTVKPSSNLDNEQDWKAASVTLSDFYRYWNLHRYDSARALLTTEYAAQKPNYSAEKMREFALGIQGGITLLNLKLIEAESKEFTKVLEYETSYVLRQDHRQHGEKLRAYIVMRNERWTIDTIQVQEYR